MALDPQAALPRLAALVAPGRAAVLSGAGISTESGIPDYRGPTGLARRAQPMTFQMFVSDEAARQRYWARSHLGWRQIAQARPNAGHLSVTRLQRLGLLTGVITQNVDGLHHAAGTRDVIELHGSLGTVVCLRCGERSRRARLDQRLAHANPGWNAAIQAVNPDGDVALADEVARRFRVVDCESCGGVLKPDVVFFGENVPRARVRECYDLLGQSRALIVLGSSLTVMSGLRYVRRAASLGIPVLIVNQGETRGDALAAATIDAPLGATLTAAVRELGAAG